MAAADPTLAAAAMAEDPHPVYAAMRSRGPVYRDRAGWCLLDCTDIEAVLGDSDRFAPVTSHYAPPAPPGLWMLAAMTGAEHDPVRSRALHEAGEDVAEDLLAPVARETLRRVWCRSEVDGRVDVATQVLPRLHREMIAALVGATGSSRGRRWGKSVVDFLVPLSEPPTGRSRRLAEAGAFEALLRRLLQLRRRRPGADPVSGLLRITARAGLPEVDQVAVLLAMLLAAAPPAGMSLGRLTEMLLTHPGSPGEELAAIGETVRLHAATQVISRRARQGTCIHGARIAAGETVHCLIAAAGRDPDRYPEPEQFNPDRWSAAPDPAGAVDPAWRVAGDGGCAWLAGVAAAGFLKGALRELPALTRGRRLDREKVRVVAAGGVRGPVRLPVVRDHREGAA